MKYVEKNLVAVAAVSIVIGAGIGYGSAHAFATRPASAPAFATGTRFMRGGQNGGLLSGTVAKEDGTSITLDTRDGSSHVVLITPTTAVSKSVADSLSDVAVGDAVIVSGTSGADGSLSAASIQLRPADSAAGGAPMMYGGN